VDPVDPDPDSDPDPQHWPKVPVNEYLKSIRDATREQININIRKEPTEQLKGCTLKKLA
jgi:hypothetical protein